MFPKLRTFLRRLCVFIFLALIGSLNAFAYQPGDFRTISTGLWEASSTWQIFDGTSWTSSTVFPGETAGNYTVTIQPNHNVIINSTGISTKSIGSIIVEGKLTLNGSNTGTDFYLNTPKITVKPNLSPYATIEFNQKANLLLPQNAVIEVGIGGLSGQCNNNQKIYVGSAQLAACNGAPGAIFTFDELMQGGGSLRSVMTAPLNACQGEVVHLSGNYAGAIGTQVNYKWSSTGPAKLVFIPDSITQNPSILPVVAGGYDLMLTVSTAKNGIEYTHTEIQHITVGSPSSSITNSVTCITDLPFVWNSKSYTASGTYKDTLVNSVGCDSIVTLHLTVQQPTTSTSKISVTTAQLPYIWNGSNYTVSGIYKDTLKTIGGCDSIAILELIVCPETNNPECPITVKDVVACPNTNTQLQASGVDYYTWYPTTGLSNASISNPIVNTPVTRKYVVTGYTEAKTNLIANGDFEAGNKSFTTSYTYTTGSLVPEGYYSVDFNPNKHHASFSACVDHTTGKGKMMIVNGNTIAKSKIWGQKITVLPNKDYAFYAYVTPVHSNNPPILQFSINGVILGEPYKSPATTCQWNKFYAIWNSGSNTTADINIINQNIEANGNDFAIDDIKYVELCKTTDTVTVNVRNLVQTTKVNVCSNELPYKWNGFNINSSGVYTYNLPSVMGCDSTSTLELTVLQATSSTKKISICEEDLPYSWNNRNFIETGIYKDTLVNSVGCDSIATLELTVLRRTTSTTKTSVCDKELPYSWNGKTLTTTGIYKDTLTNAVGCDSIATLELTVLRRTTSTSKASVCDKELPYNWNGKSFIMTGIYKDTLVNSVGCDSIATLELTVLNSTSSTTKASVCDKELPYNWNGKSFTITGIYKDTLTNAVGCDSIATLELTVLNSTSSTTKVSVCDKELPYVWNGKSYTQTGIYKDTLTNAVGCDSIATLELTVLNSTSSTTKASVCDKELPYVWNTQSYTQSGIYKDILTNAVGCDSIATLELTVLNSTSSTTKVSVCDKELPYVWNTQSYTQTGIYKDTLTNVVGCDSIATLELTVLNSTSSTTKVSVCDKELPYNWNGKSFNQTGIYKDTLTNAVGCDSIATLELTVLNSTSSITKASVCDKELPYVWNAKSYTQTGIYKDTLVNSVGCDSIATLELTVLNSTSSTTKVSVCDKELPYVWNTQSYIQSGIYKDTLTNAVGCDSIATIELTVLNSTSSTTKATVSDKELPYNWNGKTFTMTGVYKDTLVNSVGCDSIATLELTVLNSTSSTTKASVCDKELPYVWNTKSYTKSGIYKDTLTNAVGCDSIATLELTVLNSTSSTSKASVRDKELPYNWNGKIFTMTGVYKDTLVNKVGCDSIATLELTVLNSTSSLTKVIVKDKELPYVWNRKSFMKAGVYKDTLVNKVGCDSIATLDLTVLPTTSTSTKIQVCSSELPFEWNNRYYSFSGVYADTLKNRVGGDSISVLNLTVLSTSKTVSRMTLCDTELPYKWNGRELQKSGVYIDTLRNAVGCDSIITLELKVNQAKVKNVFRVICPLQLPFKWNGIICESQGLYTYYAKTKQGCDSIVNLDLRVDNPLVSITEMTLCPSELPYKWNDISCQEEGTFSKRLNTVAGCDSVAILKLHVYPVKSNVKSVNLCEGECMVYNGVTYNEPGAYKVQLQSNAGCDSIVVLMINYSTGANVSQAVHLIPGETVTVNGNVYSEEGTYTEIMKTKNQCDSIVVTDVIYLPVPNTITPNGDGVNDHFMRGFKVKIYNRNGILMSSGDDGWDGTYKGKVALFDTYFYVLYYESGTGIKTKEGYVTLVR